MPTCASCSGRGTNTCPSCGGRKFHSRITSSGDMDMSPCGVCAGRGTVRCQFCGGRGTVGSDPPPPARFPGRHAGHDDPLAGRWSSQQGGSYEFAKQGSAYVVVEYGALGRTGNGRASLKDNVVRLDISNVMLGQYSLSLRLTGDTLRGQLNVMGVPMPFVLMRD